MSVPLVLLPALMCDARVFSYQIADLSRDHMLVAAPLTGEDRIETLAKGLAARLPTRFAVLGLGFGGMVAMELLRQVPGRIDRVCLMSTSPLADTPDMAAACEPMIVRAGAGKLTEVLAELTPPDHFAAGPDRAEVLQQMMLMGTELGADVFRRQFRAQQRRSDQQATLRRCKVPALIVCGAEGDGQPVKRHSFMATLMPDAVLEVIDGAGRIPPLEQPDRVTALIRGWLSAPLVLK